MKRISEDKITFTTVKKGEHVELWISVAGWEGQVDESGVNYVAPTPRRWYVVRWAHRTNDESCDGFTLEEVDNGVFEFKLDSRDGAKEEAARHDVRVCYRQSGAGAGHLRMAQGECPD